MQGINRAPVVSASPSSGRGDAFPFRWEWADTDGDILRCVFDIADPARCVYAGGCWNIGGTANGSSDCEARTRLGTDPPVHCEYRFACFDGWVTSSTTFTLN